MNNTPPADTSQPELVAQLRQLHQPSGIYDECDHDHDEDDAIAETAIDCGDFLSCADGLVYHVCSHCCRDAGGQTEACADAHDHGPGKPICETAGILDAFASLRLPRPHLPPLHERAEARRIPTGEPLMTTASQPGEPWVCYCGAVEPFRPGVFPHADCQGGRPVAAPAVAAAGTSDSDQPGRTTP